MEKYVEAKIAHFTLEITGVEAKLTGCDGSGPGGPSCASLAGEDSRAPTSDLHTRTADVRLPRKGNSNSHGARPVHLIITMRKWIRTSRLSIKNSLSLHTPTGEREGDREGGRVRGREEERGRGREG